MYKGKDKGFEEKVDIKLKVFQLSHGATLPDHGASTTFQSHPAQSQICSSQSKKII